MPKDSVLSVHKAAKFFGNRLIFKNVSCELERGEVLLVAGPNGAGKSTLMKIMAGLASASAGEIELRLEPEQVAYLGHDTFIYPALTASENLKFWASMYGCKSDDATVDAALERVGLLRFAAEKAGGFSRGMSQRLNLARVWMVQPQLIFLDEPGTGLDVKSLGMLRDEIRQFRSSGVSVVWISHHVAEDCGIADKVLELANGGVGYFGPASGYTPGGPIC